MYSVLIQSGRDLCCWKWLFIDGWENFHFCWFNNILQYNIRDYSFELLLNQSVYVLNRLDLCIGRVIVLWHFKFYTLKCKNFLIGFLNESGNLKQKILHFKMLKILHFTATDPLYVFKFFYHIFAFKEIYCKMCFIAYKGCVVLVVLWYFKFYMLKC